MRPLLTHISLFTLLAALPLAALPLAAHAATLGGWGPIISSACTCTNGPYTGTNGATVASSSPAWGCVLQTTQNLLNVFVAVATVIITLFIAQAGFTFMASPTNPENRTKARARILNAVLGLLIVLAAWLLVDSVMKVLYNPNVTAGGVQFGPWNAILSNGTNPGPDCLKPQNPSALPNINAPANGAGGAATAPSLAAVPATTPATTPTSGDIPSKICAASQAYEGASTASGPGGGDLACAWSVNNVLQNAGLSPIGSNQVQQMESSLEGGRGQSISQSSAECGDIVIEAGDGHVGICQNSGCTQVLSNSSSKATFSWTSGPDFAPSYSNGVGRFYRVTN